MQSMGRVHRRWSGGFIEEVPRGEVGLDASQTGDGKEQKMLMHMSRDRCTRLGETRTWFSRVRFTIQCVGHGRGNP